MQNSQDINIFLVNEDIDFGLPREEEHIYIEITCSDILDNDKTRYLYHIPHLGFASSGSSKKSFDKALLRHWRDP